MVDAAVIKSRIRALRQKMRQARLDGLLIETADPHLSEYIVPHWATREYLTGFTGSYGTLLVTAEKAALVTDSRYWEQAERQLAGTGIDVQKLASAPNRCFAQWFARWLHAGQTVGFDWQLMSQKAFEQLGKLLAKNKLKVQDSGDFIEALWEGRPALPTGPIYPIQRPQSPSPTTRLTAALKGTKRALLLASLDNIAYLTELRGSDFAHSPLFFAYAVLMPDGAIELFVDPAKLTSKAKKSLQKQKVKIHRYSALTRFVKQHKELGFIADPNEINAALWATLKKNVSIKAINNPLELIKAQKTPDEIEQIRQAMVTDGLALVRFHAWLDSEKNSGELDELSIAAKLAQYRQANPDFVSESFVTICAFGENAALPHYQATPQSYAKVQGDGFLLIDSGAQYQCGTTDITRTVPVGFVTSQMRRDYTAVLRGHIRLALSHFPLGLSSQVLDVLAREPLWAEGDDYGHGTGHGVGFFLNVHEGPQRISYPRPAQSEVTISSQTAMLPAMVTSCEPGLYRSGRWGIRIENLIVTVPAETTEFGQFLKFETLTLCPIELTCARLDALQAEEIAWLNAYHGLVRKALAPHLQREPTVLAWLIEKTRPVR